MKKKILIILLLIIFSLIAVVTIFHKNKFNSSYKYNLAIVMSESMNPTIYKNDLIIFIKENNYKLNDIVVYEKEGNLIVHRIVSIENNEIVTKGDANNVNDAKINVNEIKGKVIKK